MRKLQLPSQSQSWACTEDNSWIPVVFNPLADALFFLYNTPNFGLFSLISVLVLIE